MLLYDCKTAIKYFYSKGCLAPSSQTAGSLLSTHSPAKLTRKWFEHSSNGFDECPIRRTVILLPNQGNNGCAVVYVLVWLCKTAIEYFYSKECLAPSSQTAGTLLRTPWPAKLTRKWSKHSSDGFNECPIQQIIKLLPKINKMCVIDVIVWLCKTAIKYFYSKGCLAPSSQTVES
jgi:hypothetical protein